MPIDLLAKALELLIGSQFVKDRLQRTEVVIRVLKQLGLDPEHPPADFEGVYNYALVEYGVGKPKPCLELFRASEIRQVFRTAFDQNNAQLWLTSAEQFLESSAIGDAVKALGLDPQRELAVFASCFIAVAKRSRLPGEVLLSHQVMSVQQQMAAVMARIDRLPTLEGMRTELARMAGEDGLMLPGASPQSCRAFVLAQQMRGWFETLGYRFESYEVWGADYFEWVIDIPVRRGRYDRILVRGMDGEVGIKDVRSLSESVAAQKADEGWVVTAWRISQAARGELAKPECEGLAAYTWDELLDQDADFSGYLDWLGAEIAQRGIEARYVPLACTKEEVDPVTHQRLGVSRYGADDGWTEGYLDRWLDDPAKEHLSILGEFGTGKTWLTLHYAARALRAYQEAQSKGMARPRLPIVIPLRDYAKAVSVESLFSEFFFRKHEIPIPGYSAFEQLNRMGKLLLIFDGFDEMAARVDKQQMINNFWELAKVVVPGSKVILTCRTEHFPEAKEGRALLNAELQASTKSLTGETPQFEVLELEKFEDGQIRQVLLLSASEGTVEQVMGNPQLLDLARRPVMTELILEALPEIEAGKPVDMSRVYLYAVRRKMERDIKADRTFTSMADKLYFLCELSWEMLSNDKMSLNYREFPDRIRKLFGAAVQEEKDLDHWHYDMMGQTMLIRNADGDYTPAHRSLLEFFVAFKFAAELGALAPDFLELAQMRGDIDQSLPAREQTWSEYFEEREKVSLLTVFTNESLEKLRSGFGKAPLAKAVLDLLVPMLSDDNHLNNVPLIEVINKSRGKTKDEVGYVGGNATTLVLKTDKTALENLDLREVVILGANFINSRLQNVDFSKSNLTESIFDNTLGRVFSVVFSPDGNFLATGDFDGKVRLWEVNTGKEIWTSRGHSNWIRSVAFSPNGKLIASSGDDKTIKLWDAVTGKIRTTLHGHTELIWSVAFSPNSHLLASSGNDQNIYLWDVSSGECLNILQGDGEKVRSVKFSPDGNTLASSGRSKTIRLWDIRTGICVKTLRGHVDNVASISFRFDGKIIVSGSSDKTIKLWDIESGQCIKTLSGHSGKIWSVVFSPDGHMFASSGNDHIIRLWKIDDDECIKNFHGHSDEVRSIDFSPNGEYIASGSNDQTIKLWDINNEECLNTLQGINNPVFSVAFSPNSQMIASASNDKTVRLWDIRTGRCLKILYGHAKWVHSVTFSPDGNILASGSNDRDVKLWDVDTGRCFYTLRGHMGPIWAVAFSPNGQVLASSSDDGNIKFWDTSMGLCLKTLEEHTDWVCSITFSADSLILASASRDRTVKIWDVSTGVCLKTLTEHEDWVFSVAFNSQSTMLATSDNGAIVKIWDVNSGQCIKTLRDLPKKVTSLVWMPNRSILVCGADEAILRVWDVESGLCLKALEGHTNWVNLVALSSDGQMIASAGQDETIRLWDADTGENLRVLRADRPYEGMNITGVKGLTPATIASLKALGAIDHSDPESPP
jgi:WD40 repeat protein